MEGQRQEGHTDTSQVQKLVVSSVIYFHITMTIMMNALLDTSRLFFCFVCVTWGCAVLVLPFKCIGNMYSGTLPVSKPVSSRPKSALELHQHSDSDSGQARVRQTEVSRIELGSGGRGGDRIRCLLIFFSGAWTFSNSIIKENEKCYPTFLCLPHLTSPANPSTSLFYTGLPR